MTAKPFISVVIPHKNGSFLLERLLATIPDQKRFQVIVVDDRSKWPELESVRNICQKRTFTELIENQGPDFNAGAARNIGLKEAKGDWVFFADSDDVFLPNAFDKLDRAAKYNFQADVVLFRCTSLTESGDNGCRTNSLLELISNFPENKSTILYQWLVPWGKLIKREFIKVNNVWFDSCLASNDVMFSTRVASVTDKIAICQDEVYCCYHNPDSLTSSIDEKKALSRLGALAKRNMVLKRNKVPIRKVTGFKYFFYSNPFLLSRKKIHNYVLWVKSFI